MTNIEEKAMVFATRAHRGQLRKYTNDPYIVHPLTVAEIVRAVPNHTEEMIAAAWLHDVKEDCGVQLPEIAVEFGWPVATMVDELSDVSTHFDGNRKARKAIDLRHTAKASPQSKTIKLADLIDNTSSIVQFDPKFAKVYLPEKLALLEVLKDGDSELWKRAYRLARRNVSHTAMFSSR
jgi:(p)ppGpp synthase/HD superfamily hydrolase